MSENATAPAGASLYPEPKSGDEVSWAAANAMILNNEVTKVFISQSLQVTLTLKDGRSLITTEPSAGSVQAVLTKCGEACQDMEFETE